MTLTQLKVSITDKFLTKTLLLAIRFAIINKDNVTQTGKLSGMNAIITDIVLTFEI